MHVQTLALNLVKPFDLHDTMILQLVAVSTNMDVNEACFYACCCINCFHIPLMSLGSSLVAYELHPSTIFTAIADWVDSLDQMPFNGANQYDGKVGTLSQPL
jgi:hypothetical protein